LITPNAAGYPRAMRDLVWISLVLGVTGCGEVQKLEDAPPGTVDAAPTDTQPDAPPCKTFNGTWQTNAISFDAQIAPTSRAEFETRGDGVTGVVAGTPIPRDEYLACCGFHLDYLGPTGGQLIWAGNATSGFEVRASCPGPTLCSSTAGIRVTFTRPVTAVGLEYPGGNTSTMFDRQGTTIATMTVQGSGTNFLGYASALPIAYAEFTDGGGENINKLLYHRCQ
jgi:hypothetical protein